MTTNSRNDIGPADNRAETTTAAAPCHPTPGAPLRPFAGPRRRWATVLGVSALVLALSPLAAGTAMAATPAVAAPAASDTPDAGLTQDKVKLPDPVTGASLNVTKFGATPGDDTDDSAAFRTAIAAAKAGDEIYVPNGRYVFTTARIALKTGVSVRGQSTTGTVITTNLSKTDDDSSIFAAEGGVKNLTLSDMSLNSSGGKPLNNVVALGNSNTSRKNVTQIAVRNLQVEKYYRMGIAVRNGDNITIEDNTIKNALATGGGGQGYGVMIGYKNSNNNRVADNTITGPAIRHGVLLQYYAHHNLVENNTITATVQDAIDLHGEDEYSNEMRLNTIKDCGEGGFGVGNTGAGHANSGPNNWIHDNTVTGCKYGVHIYRKSNTQFVNDNEFSRNTQNGMLIEADGGAADVHFTHNKVLNNASTGVFLNKAPGVQLVGNIVTGNKGAALITDTATTNYRITDNDFSKNAGGVKLPTTTGTFTDNTPNTYTK